MSLIQIIHNIDDQELQMQSEELCFSNTFKEAVPSDIQTDVKQILNFKIYSTKTESHLCKNHNNSNKFFSKLKQINVSFCGLTEIPNVIFDLKYLSILNLSNNSLESLPEELGSLCNLVTLKLSGNKLSYLPKSIKHIQQLNYLDLSFNKFSEVPDILYNSLRVLRVLDLSCNEITKFNDPPGCLNKLVCLGLSDNFFNEIPNWIFNNLCQLEFLDISQNQLKFYPDSLNYCNSGIFESLQSLNIKNCNLSLENIQILFFFKNLKVLHLGNKKDDNGKLKGKNYMGNLKIEKLKNANEVRELHISNALIATLSADFDCLKNIEILDLSDNLLSWLPESFCNLISLKILNLAANQLLFLPITIGNLINLTQIHLGNNKLSDIPESFYNLLNLEYADFYNNQIEKLNPSIFKGKNLKGLDLEFNCLQFTFNEYSVDVNEIKVLYNCLKDSFRKRFSYAGSRSDLQMPKIDKGLDEISNDSHSVSTKCSTSSFESEPSVEFEDLPINIAQQSHDEDEDWEKRDSCQIEEDEFFDPNEMHIFQQPVNLRNLNFRNNYCPANFHARPIMKTYARNYKQASRNVTVEEGQFDSD